MALPQLNAAGDLPQGVHRARLSEVLRLFGSQHGQRGRCTRQLSHIYELARRTGYLKRFVIFGSYVTAKEEPNDVDIVLVLDDEFRLENCPLASRGLFDHAVAQARYGASVFWVRPGMLIGETVEQFIEYWQVKRGGDKRGIVDALL
jgi:hypothetical protein